MESLGDLVSYMDEIEVLCPEHNIPCIGICVEYFCRDKLKFLCMKCIKEGGTCITKEKHELVSLSEFLYRFFIRQENKTIDLAGIQTMTQIIQEYENSELEECLNNFHKITENNINLVESFLKDQLDLFIKESSSENKESIEKIKDLFKVDENMKKEINKLLEIKINNTLPPKDKLNDQQILDFMKTNLYIDESNDSTKSKKFINDIKALSDNNKVNEIVTKISDEIYIDNIISVDENKKKLLEEKLDNFLNEIELEFDNNFKIIESEIIKSPEDNMFYSTKNSIVKFKTDPTNLIFKENITSSAHKTNSIDCVFCTFKSLQNETLVVWGTPIYSIEFYDLAKNMIIKTIHEAHRQTIFSCRHTADLKNKRDLLITSSYDKNVKVWDIRNYSNILTIPAAHSGYYIYSVNIVCVESENKNYIITAAPNEQSKIWDFSGKLLLHFGGTDQSTYFIDSYFDCKQRIHYIIDANSLDVKSYIFKTGELYKKYKGSPQTWHMSAIVLDIKDKTVLIESDGNGHIRIWEFHTANLVKTISSSGMSINLRGICLWNEEFIFSAGSDYSIHLYDINKGSSVKSFQGHTSTVCTLQKIVHPLYGECLISQGLDGKLKLWIKS